MAKRKVKKFEIVKPKEYLIKDRTCILVSSGYTDFDNPKEWQHTIKDVNTKEYFHDIPDKDLKKYL